MELNIITPRGNNVYIRRERNEIKFFQISGNKVVADCRLNVHSILNDILHCDEIELNHNNRWDASPIIKFTKKEAVKLLKKLGFQNELEELTSVRP